MICEGSALRVTMLCCHGRTDRRVRVVTSRDRKHWVLHARARREVVRVGDGSQDSVGCHGGEAHDDHQGRIRQVGRRHQDGEGRSGEEGNQAGSRKVRYWIGGWEEHEGFSSKGTREVSFFDAISSLSEHRCGRQEGGRPRAGEEEGHHGRR